MPDLFVQDPDLKELWEARKGLANAKKAVDRMAGELGAACLDASKEFYCGNAGLAMKKVTAVHNKREELLSLLASVGCHGQRVKNMERKAARLAAA